MLDKQEGNALNIHEFGKQNSDILLMFHGACMYWNMYEEALGILAEHYHVIIPALPGHDLDTDENFTSIEQIDSEIEDWLLARGDRQIEYVRFDTCSIPFSAIRLFCRVA